MPLVCQLSPSCALVRLRGYRVLLLRGDPQGLPVSGEALGTIDTVLVSSASAMLMLPSLTQAAGFRGQVVATAAALRLGEQLLLERVALHAAAREHSLEMAASAPDQQSSAADVAACVGRVKSVSFGERVELSCSVHAVALPAGCGIGAAVWSVQAAGERIVLVSACSPPPELFNGQGGSAQLSEGTRQRPGQASSLADASAWLAVSACRPMRPAPALCAADLLLLGGLRRTATPPPAEALRTACAAACDACARGGNVLVPLALCGTTFSLIEAIAAALRGRGLDVPIYVLSPVASACLTLANVLPEWVEPQRQAKAARADPAFGFDELMAAGRLRHGRQLAELRAPLPQPCVVLASQPEPSDLRLGDAPRLLQRWRAQADSLLLLTSPWHTPDLLARLGPLGLRTLLCPIDVRIDQAQASLLLRELQPHRVLWLADEPAFAAHPQSASSSTPLAAAAPPTAPAAAPPADPRHSSAAVKQLVLCEPVTLRFKRRFVHARMPTDAARAVSLRPLPGGVRGSRVRATLRPTEDGTMVLLPGAATGDVGGASEDKELATLYGEQDTPALLAALRKRGLRPVLQEGHAGHEGHEGPTAVVRLAGVEGVRIELRQGESTVYLQHSTQAIGSLVTEALREQLL